MSWRDDWQAVKALANPRDGYVDTYFNRHLSRPITVLLARTRITPNQVTILSGIVGIAAGATIALGGYWDGVVGALLLQLSVVFDDVDGELARLTRRFSDWGEMLDNSMDTVTHLAVFSGIIVAVSRFRGIGAAMWPGALLLSGVAVTFALVTYLERRVFPRGGDLPAARRLQRFVELLSGRDSSVVVLAFALAGRLDWFLYGAAVGAHAFWVIVLWGVRGTRAARAS